MAATPAGRVAENTEVLLQHLYSLANTLEDPSIAIPNFDVSGLGNEELIRKAKLEANTYSTISEMETQRQMHLVTAEIRAYNMSRVNKQGMLSFAESQVAKEIEGIKIEQLLSGRAIEQRTLAQRGRS